MIRFALCCTRLTSAALALALALGLAFGAGAMAATHESPAEAVERLLGSDVFRLPALAGGLRRVRELMERGERDAAAAALDRLDASFPQAGIVAAARAVLLEGKVADQTVLETLAVLLAPVQAACPTAGSEAGSRAGALEGIEPALISENAAPVTAANTRWDLRLARLRSGFVFPPILDRRPISPKGGRTGRGELPAPVLRELQGWFLRGRAAGLAGTVYDNRDRGHSGLSKDDWPQLAFTRYSKAARAAGLDYGLNADLLFDAPTFGNSSTALTGSRFWRSQARLALTSPEGPERLFQLYAHDHLYVYPEHNDHDPIEAGGKGDLFPANTPYFLVSQGSSGSDRPFLVAVAAILAALKPEVRAFLDGHNLVAPTVQMVFRRGLAGLEANGGGPEAYMSARAHPSVFRAEDIDLLRMIRIAQALQADGVPPMPCIRVVEETRPIPRVGIFADGISEALFDTPSAIARVWRGSGAERRLTVSAAETQDPNGRALSFHWRLLRGDPDRVRIEPQGEQGAEALISIGWHERGTVSDRVPGGVSGGVPGAPGITSDRVDIAVFADNGATLSAPAFVSMLFPGHQRRIYEPLPDGTQRVAEIDHASPERDKVYSDPLVFPRRDWRDSYLYDEQGRLLGWTRRREGAPEESFTRNGLRVLERDALGRPVLAEEIAYPLRPDAKGRAEVIPTPTGRLYDYVYGSEADRGGAPMPHVEGRSE